MLLFRKSKLLSLNSPKLHNIFNTTTKNLQTINCVFGNSNFRDFHRYYSSTTKQELSTFSNENDFFKYIKNELKLLLDNKELDNLYDFNKKSNDLLKVISNRQSDGTKHKELIDTISKLKFNANRNSQGWVSFQEIQNIRVDQPKNVEVLKWLITYWGKRNPRVSAELCFDLFKLDPNELLKTPSIVNNIIDHLSKSYKIDIGKHFFNSELESIEQYYMIGKCLVYIENDDDYDYYSRSKDCLTKVQSLYLENQDVQYKPLFDDTHRLLIILDSYTNYFVSTFYQYLPNTRFSDINDIIESAHRHYQLHSNDENMLDIYNAIENKFKEGNEKSKEMDIVHYEKSKFISNIVRNRDGCMSPPEPFDYQALTEAENNNDKETVAILVRKRLQKLSNSYRGNEVTVYPFYMGFSNRGLKEMGHEITNGLPTHLVMLREYSRQLAHMDTSKFSDEQKEYSSLFQRSFKFMEPFMEKILKEDNIEENPWIFNYTEILVDIEPAQLYVQSEISDAYEKLQERNDFMSVLKTVETLENHLFHRTDMVETVLLRGVMSYQKGDYKEAGDKFIEFIDTCKKQELSSSYHVKPMLSYLIDCLRHQKRDSEIDHYVHWYISLNPTDIVFNNSLLEIFVMATFPNDKSEQILLDFLKSGYEPNNIDIYDYLAKICRNQEKYNDALNYIEHGLKHLKQTENYKNKLQDLLMNKADILGLINTNNWKEKIQLYKKALSVDETSDSCAIIHLKIAETAFSIDNNKLALKHSSIAIKILEETLNNSPNPQVKDNLIGAFSHYATALNSTGRYNEAFLVCKSAMKIISTMPNSEFANDLFMAGFIGGFRKCVNVSLSVENFYFMTLKELDIDELILEADRNDCKSIEESKSTFYMVLDIIKSLQIPYGTVKESIYQEFLNDFQESVQFAILSINFCTDYSPSIQSYSNNSSAALALVITILHTDHN
ncbi:hypothetical protein DLAC_02851 [Tieghemostelium lacteum]|uniref:Uncharacterized protein n=1 Tax=Tieghemostelium lacteum TaxID=361077 RepID=A0A152A3H8_TIELA|nr:hypothetical protein DLAC_02851 [Tieghemostelium lacteum]|eukprot:KYR00798.1 hypothetical protein DLAC_02851 [Tieghemostelium lacteum]